MTIVWNWPQITFVTLTILGLLVTVRFHGEPRTGKYSVVSFFIASAIDYWLLYYGGFFNGTSP